MERHAGGEQHGATKGGKWTPSYSSYRGMKNRCLNPKASDYAYYGGRGIGVCDQWKASYAAFLSDMGERPPGEYTLDRVDTNGDYCPENCRWVHRSQQPRNRRYCHYVEYQGERLTIFELSKRVDAWDCTLRNRILQKGMTAEQAVALPFKRAGRVVGATRPD